MNRRKFLRMLAGLPFVGLAVKLPESTPMGFVLSPGFPGEPFPFRVESGYRFLRSKPLEVTMVAKDNLSAMFDRLSQSFEHLGQAARQAAEAYEPFEGSEV